MDMERDLQNYFAARRNGKSHGPSPSAITPKVVDEADSQQLDLGWLFAVIRRRAPLMIGVAVALTALSGGTIVWASKQITPEYSGFFRLLVEPVTAEDRFARQFLSSQNNNADIQKIEVEKSSLLDYETQIRVLQSTQLMNPVVDKINQRYPDITYNSLMAKLMIYRVNYEKDGSQVGTKILEVSYQDPDQEKIKFILETISQAYLNYSRQERLSSLQQGIKFIDQQLPDLQAQVDTLQNKLQKLRQDYNVTDPQQADYLILQQVLQLQKERVAAEAELAQTRVQYETLQSQLQGNNPTAVLAIDNQTYLVLLQELQKLEARIASESPQFRDDSPPMLALREKQQNLQALLRREANGVLNKLAGRIQGLEQQTQTILRTEMSLRQRLGQLPIVARQSTDLQQKLGIATENLKEFLAKREALKLDAAQQSSPWELIEPTKLYRNEFGELISVANKQTKKQLALAIVLSALFSLGLGFLVEALNTVFHTPEDVKGETKLPVLGVIPFTKALKPTGRKKKPLAPLAEIAGWNQRHGSSELTLTEDIVAILERSSPFLEAFRSLYTNIRLLNAEKPIYSLAVGSAVPADGKSTVAMYLAEIAAAVGQRVLVVDADLRCPQLHTRFNLPNVRGLSDAIATEVSLNDVIQRSPFDSNLFVLTAGQSVKDPIKLLSSDKMQYLMEQFQARFDLVIYDTPPLVGLADGNLIAAYTDGMILVVGLDKTDRAMLGKAIDGLKIAGACILGMVANGVRGYTPPTDSAYGRVYSR